MPPIPKSSPLGCILMHWKEGQFGQEMQKRKLVEYCNVWWTQYDLEGQVLWPENGTLDYSIILQLMQFCRHEGKWDEIPYVELFFILRGKEEWKKACGIMVVSTKSDEQCKGCVTEKKCMKCLAVENALQHKEDDDFDLLVAPSAPPAPRDTGVKGDGEDEVEIEEQEYSTTPVSHRTRQRDIQVRQQAPSAILAPLRQGVGAEGPVYVKVPFTPGDLMLWKQSAGTYRENPSKVARVVKMILKTQNPDWDDIQVLLDTLMDSTEKEMVLRTARERVREDSRQGIVTGTVDQNFPTEDPMWDYNTARGMSNLRRYQEWIVVEVQNAMPKTINWSKLYNVRQEKTESPSVFLERLKEVARKYTDLDAETEQAKVQLALIFLGQSQDAIRKKLQKREGAELRDLDGLLETAWEVYNNRERESSQRQQRHLLAVMQRRGQHNPAGRDSRKLFAFEWENPHNGRKMQLTWTRLPQGFKNSPTLFGNQLAKELESWTMQEKFQELQHSEQK
ncbi:uncharacterized protein LOC128850785 isoform X2 [Cuculus canorus]|uniref:uncharacterized protein LOC128850785 isoform X2 n=1 Tax=Cuculus canorus TaxID=55661 RepID=UPI0023AA4BD0|nr:uncharacterized protein LOC128850785 isoform X2 [Cuculus canorus]